MRDRLIAAVLAALLGAACSAPPPGDAAPPTGATARPTGATAPPAGEDVAAGTPQPAAPEVTPSGPFPAAAVELRPGTGEPVTVAVHVAADVETRRRGLMGREHLPRGTGMLFLFPEDTEGAFWMKDTLVPLSIAFADARGRIVRVLDMQPCAADPCPVHRPGVAYRYALEVPQGAFDDAGIAEGDVLVLPDDLPGAR